MRRAGFTLVEVLVGAGLLGLLLLAASGALVPVLHIWQENQARSEVEQTGLVLETRMARELEVSCRDSVQVQSNPSAVGFLSMGDPSTASYDAASGQPVWHNFVIYYLDSENKVLYRKIWPVAGAVTQVPVLPYVFPTKQTPRLQPTELQALCASENGSETRAAYYVADLTVTNDPAQALGLDLVLSAEAVNGVESAHRHRDVEMRQ